MRFFLLCFLLILLAEIAENQSADYRNPSPRDGFDGAFVFVQGIGTASETKKGERNDGGKVHPNNGIGFVVEGIEKSDFGLSLRNSNFQRSRAALGFQKCEDETLPARQSSLVKVFYESQKGPSNYEPEAIRVLCWNEKSGMAHFCACNEKGECFVPTNLPKYVEVQPYCDPEEGACHAYLEMYGGRLKSEDDPNTVYWHPFDSGPFGLRSPYMKVSAISCEGCGRIRKRNGAEGKCSGEFTRDAMDKQKLSAETLLIGEKFNGTPKEKAVEGNATTKGNWERDGEIATYESLAELGSGSRKNGSDRSLFILLLFISFTLFCFL